MSYSIGAKFCRKDKNGKMNVILDTYADILKILGESAYDYRMEDVEPIYSIDKESTDEVSRYHSYEFKGKLSEEDAELLSKCTVYDYGNPNARNLYIPHDIEESERERILNGLNDNGTINIFTQNERNENGSWYNMSSFSSALTKYENLNKDKQVKLNKLNAIKESIEYYRLTDEQKESLEDDIMYMTETVEENNGKVYACQYMMNVMDAVYESKVYDIFDYNEPVFVFIYVC